MNRVKVKCAACGAPEMAERGDGLRVCPACGLVAAANQMFGSRAYTGLAASEIYAASKKGLFLQALDSLDGVFRPGARLLDIGCADGSFAALAAARGWKAEGVEISKELAERAGARGLRVHTGQLAELGLPAGSFDAVTLLDVLSLVPDPGLMAGEAWRLLAPGGILLVRELNADFHLPARRLGALPGLSTLGLAPGVEHNWNFNARSLTSLLSGKGFSQVRVRNSKPTEGDPYHTGGLFGPGFVSFFKKCFWLGARAAELASGGRVLAASALIASGRKGPA